MTTMINNKTNKIKICLHQHPIISFSFIITFSKPIYKLHHDFKTKLKLVLLIQITS